MQSTSNDIWFCVTAVLRHSPLRETRHHVVQGGGDANAQNITTLAWSWWRMSVSSQSWPLFEDSHCRGTLVDAMGMAYGVMLAEWGKEEEQEKALYGMMEKNPFLGLPAQLFELVSRWRSAISGGPDFLVLPSVAYKKIALLLDFVEL
mmetsp:Transcript_26058/g.60727  ORF Transcript_26058/g.60727 Transcript_26058/m.60727 type:complete len:148 (-) Transcript_26058:748-1191(-)